MRDESLATSFVPFMSGRLLRKNTSDRESSAVPNAATLIGFVTKARARRRETSSTMAPSNDSMVLSDIEINDPLVLQDPDSATTWPKAAAPIKFHSRFNRGRG